jgi:hypothetical protein
VAGENEKNQAKFTSSTALINTKTSLLNDIIESIDSHQNHPKSFMGGIKSSCDD